MIQNSNQLGGNIRVGLHSPDLHCAVCKASHKVMSVRAKCSRCHLPDSRMNEIQILEKAGTIPPALIDVLDGTVALTVINANVWSVLPVTNTRLSGLNTQHVIYIYTNIQCYSHD